MLWAILLEHMHKKFDINQAKIKGGCQLGRKVVPHNSKSDLPLTIHNSLSDNNGKDRYNENIRIHSKCGFGVDR